MIDTRKLCQAIGIHDKSFYIDYETGCPKTFTPYVLSSYAARRQIEPHVASDEKELLYETEVMYSEMIQGLTDELKAIRRFRQTFHSQGSNPDKKVSDTG